MPIGHGRQLYNALPGPKRFLETGGGHNDGGFLQRAEWREAVRRFLAGESARHVKASPEFIDLRERVLGIIFADEEAVE